MHRVFQRFLASALVLVAHGAALAQALQEVRISSQPALFGSLPFAVAEEKGWWKEVGLKVTITNFTAGAPQIAAIKSWDIGYTGSVPAVLGTVRHGLETIAITDDQSATNALVVRGDKAALPASPKSAPWVKGMTLAVTVNSTVDLVTRACLRRWGIKPEEVTIKPSTQAEILAGLSSGTIEIGSLWAPNLYAAEEKAGARVLCSGKDSGTFVPGSLVVRSEWAEQNPQLAAKVLAVYLRAQRWMAANRKEALAVMKKHYEAGGVQISEAAMKREFDSRTTFSLARQLALFERGNRGNSDVDNAMFGIAFFLRIVGTLKPEDPIVATTAYATDKYLRLVDADDELKGFARRTN